jgi:hypothetical protein
LETLYLSYCGLNGSFPNNSTWSLWKFTPFRSVSRILIE